MSGGPAAITGIGAVTPLGIGADVLFERWRDGVSGLDGGKGVCEDFDPAELMTRKQIRRTERFVQLGLQAAEEAVEQAWGLDALPYEPERVACILGVSLGGTQVLFDQYQTHQESGAEAVWPLTIPVTMPNATPAVLAMRHGFRGETRSIASACASSAQAIGEGMRMLRAGDADAVIVGGSESCLTEFILAAFRTAGALSRSGVSRPFDRDRDGFVMSEGAGIMVLEDPERAEKRGATTLGYVTGYGSTTDGHHLVAPADDGKVCASAITQSLADAGREPDDVDVINAHGTSTPQNDSAETTALKVAFGDHAYRIPVSAPKSVLGHSIGAAGGVEAITLLQTLRRREVPPTVGLSQPGDGLDLDYVPRSAKPLGPNESKNGDGDGRLVGISNSFAFGGHNATVTIEA